MTRQEIEFREKKPGKLSGKEWSLIRPFHMEIGWLDLTGTVKTGFDQHRLLYCGMMSLIKCGEVSQ